MTVVIGPNGAGKTNLLEALYFGCTGRSCRTNNEREVVRFGAGARGSWSQRRGEDGAHELRWGSRPGSRSECGSTALPSSGCSMSSNGRW